MLTLEILRAARRQLDDAQAWKAFADAAAALYGWRSGPETALTRVSQWLAPDLRRHLPATALPTLIDVTGRDYLSPLLAIAHLRAHERRGPLRSESEPALERRRRR